MNRQTQTIAAPLIFGIYPGAGVDGNEPLLFPGPADDPARINDALDQLQPAQRPFLVRGYVHYIGDGQVQSVTPKDVRQYLRPGRLLDLVLCFRSRTGDLADWTAFIQTIIRQHGPALTKLQITEEPNNPDPALGGDGSTPQVRPAIIAGVIAAKEEADRLGHPLQVGFNTTISFHPKDEFWLDIAKLGGQTFVDALDYVGLDFFPDVFQPLPPGADGQPMSFHDVVLAVLSHHRTVNLTNGNIPATMPLHITENGWPTSPMRSPARQAEVLETIVRTIDAVRGQFNITHYEFFNLRDTDSANGDQLQFGLLYDDYTPKPAFYRYQGLIAELGM